MQCLFNVSGFEITKLLEVGTRFGLLTAESKASIEHKIEHFEFEQFIRQYHLDYVMPERCVKQVPICTTYFY